MEKERIPKGEQGGAEIHSFTLRISKNTSERAKKYAEKTGASVNSAICILLDLGLNVVEN